jgi:hypothetical protein
MNYSLKEVLQEIGTITVPSTKGELSFVFEEKDDELFIVYREHKPDGTYTESDVYTFTLD